MKVYYHKNCNDGFTAAWLFRQKYPDADFIARDYIGLKRAYAEGRKNPSVVN